MTNLEKFAPPVSLVSIKNDPFSALFSDDQSNIENYNSVIKSGNDTIFSANSLML